MPYYDKMYGGANRWKFSYVSSLSIGEGELLVSPLKLANLAAAIANRGWFITPHYVRGFGRAGAGLPAEYTQRHETGIDRAYFLPVIDGMRRTMVNGSARSVNLPTIDLCGKTGTSQNAKFGHRYDHSVFVGFAPMNDPKIAIAVFVENAGWGSDVAAPIAALIAERYIHKRTISKHVATRMMNAYYLPPAESGSMYRKPAPRRSRTDSTRTGQPRRTDSIPTPKSLAPKPLMTNQPRPVQSAGLAGN